MKKSILFLAILLLLVATVSAIRQTNKSNLDVHLKKVQLNDNVKKIKALENAKATSEDQLEKVNKERLELEQKNKDLEAQVQAKAQIKAQRGPVAYAATIPGGGGDDKDFIYSHESGNNPGAIAPNGACGLGQALPCSKMPCGLTDYACQDSFFTQYMLGRYGSWANARAFWEVNRWW